MKTYTREVYTFRMLKMSVDLEGHPDYEPTADELDEIAEAAYEKDAMAISCSVTLESGRTFHVKLSHKPGTVWFEPEQFDLEEDWQPCDPLVAEDEE